LCCVFFLIFCAVGFAHGAENIFSERARHVKIIYAALKATNVGWYSNRLTAEQHGFLFCERDLHGCKAVAEKCEHKTRRTLRIRHAAYTFTTIENATCSFTMPASFDFIANGPKSGSQVSKRFEQK